MRTYSCLIIILAALSCSTTEDDNNINKETGAGQSLALTFNGRKTTMNPEQPENAVVATLAFTDGYLGLSVLHENDDLQFFLQAALGELKPGAYDVFDCLNTGEECEDKNQKAFWSTYPYGSNAKLSGKFAYKSTILNLAPLRLNITSVEDAVMPGSPFPVKRVKALFTANLAQVDRDDSHHYFINGPLLEVSGDMDMMCTLR